MRVYSQWLLLFAVNATVLYDVRIACSLRLAYAPYGVFTESFFICIRGDGLLLFVFLLLSDCY
jgi:hypothetical protein